MATAATDCDRRVSSSRSSDEAVLSKSIDATVAALSASATEFIDIKLSAPAVTEFIFFFKNRQ